MKRIMECVVLFGGGVVVICSLDVVGGSCWHIVSRRHRHDLVECAASYVMCDQFMFGQALQP